MNSRSLPQNKAPFDSDPLAKFLFLHENMCRRSEHFRLERRVPFWWEGWDEWIGTQKWQWKWPKDGRATPGSHSSLTYTASWVEPSQLKTMPRACMSMSRCELRLWRPLWMREEEREKSRWKEKERKRERQQGRDRESGQERRMRERDSGNYRSLVMGKKGSSERERKKEGEWLGLVPIWKSPIGGF